MLFSFDEQNPKTDANVIIFKQFYFQWLKNQPKHPLVTALVVSVIIIIVTVIVIVSSNEHSSSAVQ